MLWMIKIDLRKAYDTIEWPFVESIIREPGFLPQLVTWVMACITIFTYRILINGLPSPRFQASRGLRQRDPMSPFIFAMGMEYLTRCIGSLG